MITICIKFVDIGDTFLVKSGLLLSPQAIESCS